MNTPSAFPRHSPDDVALPGSERPRPHPAAVRSAPAVALADDEELSATVYLRRGQPVAEGQLPGGPPAGDLLSRHGAEPGDVELVRSTLEGLGAKVAEVDPAARRLRVRGTHATLSSIFGTQLERVQATGPAQHRRSGGLRLPAALDGVVTAVLGLDNRPAARPHFHHARTAPAAVSYTPLELARIYDFPSGTTGSGSVIAIIELGGGFGDEDLETYFAGLGLPTPKVTAVEVDGAKNTPGADPQGADGEVLLDIEVAGALAPEVEIKVYFAPNTDAGFVNAVSAAAHATPTPVAISISWGQDEDDWTAQARGQMDEAFIDATLRGATVTVAAGDNGSADQVDDGKNHADFPASSPHALACGGTSLRADHQTGAVGSETVWNDSTHSATGGGVSDVYGSPSWQDQVTVSTEKQQGHRLHGRGVPDVSAVADPQTGYQVRVDGKNVVMGGTSAVAPLWAGLLARCAAGPGTGRGLLQPGLYAGADPGRVPAGFRDITSGNNGTYRATTGWDACTGLGVPQGSALFAVS